MRDDLSALTETLLSWSHHRLSTDKSLRKKRANEFNLNNDSEEDIKEVQQ